MFPQGANVLKICVNINFVYEFQLKCFQLQSYSSPREIRCLGDQSNSLVQEDWEGCTSGVPIIVPMVDVG
jgi:hypothetical protein